MGRLVILIKNFVLPGKCRILSIHQHIGFFNRNNFRFLKIWVYIYYLQNKKLQQTNSKKKFKKVLQKFFFV